MTAYTSSKDLRVSISGVRGIVERSFTNRLVRDFAVAFSRVVKGRRILIAQDTRPTGGRFRRVAIEGLREAGCDVIDIGTVPTPTVLFMVRRLRAKGGMIITASHNPKEWNGLKFVGRDGQFLDQKAMNTLIRFASQEIEMPQERRGRLSRDRTAMQRHLQQVLRHLDVPLIRKRKFHVAIDPCNGTGGVGTRAFLRKLGCRVSVINGNPDGRFAHAPEPTEENLKQLSRWVKKTRADLGFAQDPDADRLAIVTEKGVPLSGEYTLALAVQYVLSQKKTPVVVNLSTSRMIQTLAEKQGVPLFYSKIGERHVVERMRVVKAAIGGEGNGGVIYPAINAARDSFVGMGLILEALAHAQRPLSRLVAGLPQYEMQKKKFTLSKKSSERLLRLLLKRGKAGRISRLDGVRVDLREGWIHARPSNTEPIVRLIVEAPSKKETQKLLNLIR